MSLIRTFISIAVETPIRAKAAELSRRLQACPIKATWTKEENLHLTLKFLGDTPDTKIPDVCRGVQRACSEFGPFQVAFESAGAFPRASNPRTLWLGVSEGVEPLRQIHRAIDDEMANLSFLPERRRFEPHITLGRVRAGGPALRDLAELLDENADFRAGRQQVREVLVMASFLDKEGPTYNVLGRAPLEN